MGALCSPDEPGPGRGVGGTGLPGGCCCRSRTQNRKANSGWHLTAAGRSCDWDQQAQSRHRPVSPADNTLKLCLKSMQPPSGTRDDHRWSSGRGQSHLMASEAAVRHSSSGACVEVGFKLTASNPVLPTRAWVTVGKNSLTCRQYSRSC